MTLEVGRVEEVSVRTGERGDCKVSTGDSRKAGFKRSKLTTSVRVGRCMRKVRGKRSNTKKGPSYLCVSEGEIMSCRTKTCVHVSNSFGTYECVREVREDVGFQDAAHS